MSVHARAKSWCRTAPSRRKATCPLPPARTALRHAQGTPSALEYPCAVRRPGRHESIRVEQVQVQSAGRVVMQVDVPMCFGEVGVARCTPSPPICSSTRRREPGVAARSERRRGGLVLMRRRRRVQVGLLRDTRRTASVIALTMCDVLEVRCVARERWRCNAAMRARALVHSHLRTHACARTHARMWDHAAPSERQRSDSFCSRTCSGLSLSPLCFARAFDALQKRTPDRPRALNGTHGVLTGYSGVLVQLSRERFDAVLKHFPDVGAQLRAKARPGPPHAPHRPQCCVCDAATTGM
jgi:hypothetical protein